MPQPISNEQKQQLIKLGERVRSIRQSKALSLQDVADKIDKDRQSIQKLEKGGFNPSYIYLLEICKGLEIDIKELF
jgi:putative transcriptional regulator